MVPERGLAITVLTNSNRGGEANEKITKWVLENMLGLKEEELEVIDLSEAELAAYAGEYEAQMDKIALYLEAGAMMVKNIPKGGFPDQDSPPSPALPPARIGFTAKDKMKVLDPPLEGLQADIIRYPDGRIRWLRTSRLFEPV